MIDIDIWHLKKVVEIQRKFIDGEIDRQKLDNELKQENERLLQNDKKNKAS